MTTVLYIGQTIAKEFENFQIRHGNRVSELEARLTEIKKNVADLKWAGFHDKASSLSEEIPSIKEEMERELKSVYLYERALSEFSKTFEKVRDAEIIYKDFCEEEENDVLYLSCGVKLKVSKIYQLTYDCISPEVLVDEFEGVFEVKTPSA